MRVIVEPAAGPEAALKRTYLFLMGALLAVGCTEQPVPESPTTPRESGVAYSQAASDLVPTPAGWYHRDCVHEVPNGSHVHIDGTVTRADGTTYRIPKCAHPGRVAPPGSSGRGPVDSGWIEWADYQPGADWSMINANSVVPANPAVQYSSNQVYYSFTGIQSSSYIVQPVLTYGFSDGYGGNSWTGAAWHCNSGSDCHHGPAISTYTGDAILGTVISSGCANGICTWTVTLTDTNRNQASTYTVDDTIDFFDAVGGAVEVYGLTACDQYPQNGIFYTGVSLYNVNGQRVSPSWSAGYQSGVSPSCDFDVSSSTQNISLYHNPVSVTVSGPNNGDAYSDVTMTATPYGGDPPYSYSWTINGGANGCGNQSTCTGQLGAGGTYTTFAVTMTDAVGQHAAGSKQVYACLPGQCPQTPQKAIASRR